MSDDRYNGWLNYETWNINLWAFNEEPLYKEVMRNQPFTAESAEELARGMFPEGTPDFDSVADFDKVDWNEIAEAWNDGYEKE